MERSNRKFSTWCKSLTIAGIFFQIFTLQVNGANYNDAENLPDTKILENGQILRRNAGSEWSRSKILSYLSSYELHFYKRISSLRTECHSIQNNLKAAKFKFVDPEFTTDNWNDPRLDIFKTKYGQFKYGLGYRADYGPVNAAIPNWNITIYSLDTDNDEETEVILYGEALRAQVGSTGGSSYRVFEAQADIIRGAGLRADPSSPYALEFPDNFYLSGIISIDGSYAVLILQDSESPAFSERSLYAEVYFLSLQDKKERGSGFNSKMCRYKLNAKNE